MLQSIIFIKRSEIVQEDMLNRILLNILFFINKLIKSIDSYLFILLKFKKKLRQKE
jgi:hypothetical protein